MKPETLIQSILSPQRSELYFQPQFLEKFNLSTQKIAILATNEFEGFSKNGGIGTYYTALSQKLAAENWCIILLLCHSQEKFQGIPKSPNIHHVFAVREVETVLQLQPIHQAILSNTQTNPISQSFDYDSFCCLFLMQAIVATFPEAVVVVSPEMKLDNNVEIFNANDGSLLKLLEFNQSRDLCALFAVEFLREFSYCEVRELQGLNWQILAAAIATDQTITYYPYPLYLSDSNSQGIIKPEQLPRERYYLRQYLSQIKPERWTQRQLHLLLTCIEQLSQLQVEKQGQLWQLHQEKNRYQALASQSQAWMQTALETQKELDALQAELEKKQAVGDRQ